MASPAKDFVHLHLHSEFSLLDGANRIPQLCARVKDLGMDAVALTDHGNMFGALAFQKCAQKSGVKPILGCEVYVSGTTRTDRRPGAQKRTNHLLLLARNDEGYRNLCKLSSIGYTEGFYYKPRVDMEMLAQHAAGLVCTSACLKGVVPQALLEEQDDKALDLVGKYRDIFGPENYFLEIQDHGIPEQHAVNKKLIPLAKRLNVGLVATNDAHYLCRDNAQHQDAAICIQTGKVLTDTDRMRFYNDQFYVKDPQEMWSLFGEVPDSLLNTRKIAEMCNASIATGEYHLPVFECPEGKTQDQYLRQLVEEGLAHRYGEIKPEARERANFELRVVHEMGFDGYFLVVWDFVKFAKDSGIPVGPGRGSAAGSIVAYSLGITDLCPLEHGLIFERFLNPGRKSMPDIDIDFCFEGRGRVIEYVKRKYGEKNVAQIITFGTLKAKAAIRDVGRIMSVPLSDVDRIASLIPEGPKSSLSAAIKDVPELRSAIEADEVTRRLYELAKGLEGLVRHASTHAAGVVIADRDLTEYIPIYQPPGSTDIVTQFTMMEVEEIGLLKMDFLGLKNLTIIDNTIRQLKKTRGIEIDWNKIPLDDPKTYELLCRGDTQGVFQLESSGMRSLVMQVKPSCFSDITAILALYRPGPLESGMASAFAERKHGRQKFKYDHAILEPILRETYGVILYQEQVMQIAGDLAGFSLADADSLRKAMGKKIKEVMEQQEANFVEGAGKNGVEKKLAKHIWDQIVTFAGYGFNKSHSAAYAVVTFRTAHLKAHYPVDYMAAQLSNEISGSNATESIAHYMAVCRPMGIKILPPDVNHSHPEFTVEGKNIRFGLQAIKNVGNGAAIAIVEARQKGGPYKGLQDLCERVDLSRVNAKSLECLIKSGAFDFTKQRRSQMFAMLPEVLEMSTALAREKASGQESLFGGADEMMALQPTRITAPDVPEWTDTERLNFEKELLGHYLTGHPLDKHAEQLIGIDLTPTTDLDHLSNGTKVDVLGLVRAIRAITTKKGDRMAFVTVEDYHGTTEVVVFSDVYEKRKHHLVADKAIWLRGALQIREERRSVIIEDILLPEEAVKTAQRWWTLVVPCLPSVTTDMDELFTRIRSAIKRHPGSWKVRLRLATEEGTADLLTGMTVQPSRELEEEVKLLCSELEAIGMAQPLTMG